MPLLSFLLAVCQTLPAWLNHLHVLFIDISISGFLNTFGYVVVFLFIGIESTGIPFPGETMLLAASVYAAQGCGLQEPLVIVACILGATTGDNLGFWIGRTGGRNLIRKYGKYVRLKVEHLEPAEAYFRRYGGATVFFGRFLAILRAWAAFLAGVNHMQPLRFFIYNLSGAILWSTTFGLLGFILGKNLDSLKRVVQTLGTIGAIVVVALAVVAIGALVLRRRRAAAHHLDEQADDAVAPVTPAPQAPASSASLQAEVPPVSGTSKSGQHDVGPVPEATTALEIPVRLPTDAAPAQPQA